MILFINACIRAESRTLRLAQHVLSKMGEPYTEVCLKDAVFPAVDDALLARRERLAQERAFSDPLLLPAAQFAAAERIVIAAPYWDLSYPAVLKQYLEQVNVVGVTFAYTPEGVPTGLCRAKELVYVATAGGTFVPEEYGFGYVKALAQGYYGIPDVRLVQAVGLDLDGADPEAILRACMERL